MRPRRSTRDAEGAAWAKAVARARGRREQVFRRQVSFAAVIAAIVWSTDTLRHVAAEHWSEFASVLHLGSLRKGADSGIGHGSLEC